MILLTERFPFQGAGERKNQKTTNLKSHSWKRKKEQLLIRKKEQLLIKGGLPWSMS